MLLIAGKLLRASKYEEEISDGHLGINEKELNSMNKHIPGLCKVTRSNAVKHPANSIQTFIFTFDFSSSERVQSQIGHVPAALLSRRRMGLGDHFLRHRCSGVFEDILDNL